MSQPVIPFGEFDYEMGVTRRVLERIPDERGDWKPHERSFSIGHLAIHVAGFPRWIQRTLEEPFIDLAGEPAYAYEPTARLLERFDANVKAGRDALQRVTGPELQEQWTLRFGDQVVMQLPRIAVVRQHLSHMIHHRGQLTVYLRLLAIPVPSVYGPTADER